MRPSGRIWVALALLLGAALVIARWLPEGGARGEPIRIAYAGPLSGTGRADAVSSVRAIELVLDEANRAGGIGGRPLVLDTYDDGNDPARAAERAREIAARDDTVAVIGHHFSSCSIAAGAVYAAQGIPAISSASTNVAVTRDNPWFFRTIRNDRDQGRLLMLYVAQVLHGERVAIVHEDQTYGAYLAEVMRQTAPEAGIGSVASWGFDADAPDLDERLDRIAADLMVPGAPPIVVLATQPDAGVGVVKRLRDAHHDGTLVVSDALSSWAFIDGFDAYPEERAHPGFYTDGIYASTPFLFDLAGEQAGRFQRDFTERYGESPDWYAAFSADAASVLVEALRRGNIAPRAGTIAEARSALRDALAAIGPLEPVAGVTGPTWFDAVGDAQKPVFMGRIQRHETISALVQLRLLPNVSQIEDLDPRYDPARVVVLGDQLLYRTDVVRVGVRAKRFDAVDFDAETFDFDFHLWFRERGDHRAEDLVFTNAVAPVTLGPVVEEYRDGEEIYRLYAVHGAFRADTLDVPYGMHSLAISFHPRERTRDDLVLAVDSLGMNLGRRSDRSPGSRPVDQLLSDEHWKVSRPVLFESTVEEHAMGHPRFLEGAGTERPFSQLTVGVTLRKVSVGLRGLAPPAAQEPLLALGLAGSAVLLLVRRGLSRTLRWALQAGLALLVLVTAEAPIGSLAGAYGGPYYRSQVTRLFDILWWLVPAVLVNLAVSRFLWEPAEERSGRAIPTLLRWSVASLIFLLAAFGVVAFVYDYTLTGLLATSGVLAMIIGLAVQLNITNLFAGVALNVERPFRVGDWIMVHGRTPDPEDGVIGQVIDINWRTTRLRTAADTEIVIPNGALSEKTITNFMAPGEMSRFELVFRVDQSVPPKRVIDVIQSALDSITDRENGGIVKDPPPKVRVQEATDTGIVYQVRYRIIPRELSPSAARHLVNTRVLDALHDAGMELAQPWRRLLDGLGRKPPA